MAWLIYRRASLPGSVFLRPDGYPTVEALTRGDADVSIVAEGSGRPGVDEVMAVLPLTRAGAAQFLAHEGIRLVVSESFDADLPF